MNKIWCVDVGGVFDGRISSQLFLTEAQADEYRRERAHMSYVKMYAVKDIWHFRERNLQSVVDMAWDELREAPTIMDCASGFEKLFSELDLDDWSVKFEQVPYGYMISTAAVYRGKLFHSVNYFPAIKDWQEKRGEKISPLFFLCGGIFFL